MQACDCLRHVLLSNKQAADALLAMSCGASIKRRGMAWRLGYEQPKTNWIRVATTGFWATGAIDDADVEYLLEAGFARRSDDGATLSITCIGQAFQERLSRDVCSVFGSIMSSNRLDALLRVVEVAKGHQPDLRGLDLAFFVAQYVLLKVFGHEWMRRHISSDAQPGKDFFRASDQLIDDRAIGIVRTVHLAEMVFNLQDVAGVKRSLGMMEKGDVEAGFAELEVAKLIQISGLKFRFIEPRQRKGDDYDLELTVHDVEACGETKCKVEATEQSIDTVVQSLKIARSQLPPDRPGIIFVAIPHSWGGAFDDGSRGKFLAHAAQKFFNQGTGRIVSVKFHTSMIEDDGRIVSPSIYTLEFTNPRHRFQRDLDWRLFYEMQHPPECWLSLSNVCS